MRSIHSRVYQFRGGASRMFLFSFLTVPPVWYEHIRGGVTSGACWIFVKASQPFKRKSKLLALRQVKLDQIIR
jgi:hypothetical protein